MKLPEIDGYWYLASPYSRYPHGIRVAFEEAASAAARLAYKGIKVYSPIVCCHVLSWRGDIDPYDASYWLDFDRPFMDAAGGLIVLQLEEWDKSYGVNEEIKIFKEAGKPVRKMRWKKYKPQKSALKPLNSLVGNAEKHTGLQKITSEI